MSECPQTTAVKAHAWQVEEIDGGPVGFGDFWICHECGASGGPYWSDDKLPTRAFLAGPALPLSALDCDAAKLVVDAYKSEGLE